MESEATVTAEIEEVIPSMSKVIGRGSKPRFCASNVTWSSRSSSEVVEVNRSTVALYESSSINFAGIVHVCTSGWIAFQVGLPDGIEVSATNGQGWSTAIMLDGTGRDDCSESYLIVNGESWSHEALFGSTRDS